MQVLKFKFGHGGDRVDAFGLRFFGNFDSRTANGGTFSEILSDPDVAPMTTHPRVTLWFMFEKIRPYDNVSRMLDQLSAILKKKGVCDQKFVNRRAGGYDLGGVRQQTRATFSRLQKDAWLQRGRRLFRDRRKTRCEAEIFLEGNRDGQRFGGQARPGHLWPVPQNGFAVAKRLAFFPEVSFRPRRPMPSHSEMKSFVQKQRQTSVDNGCIV